MKNPNNISILDRNALAALTGGVTYRPPVIIRGPVHIIHGPVPTPRPHAG